MNGIATITPEELHALLLGEHELALLDLREQGAFGESHLLYAACLPLSRLELRIGRLVPRRSVPLVLCDGGEGLAERGATKLAALGYEDVRVLAGGTPAWEAAGYTAFSGINVPSKAFGEYIEHEFDTPSVSAEELKAMMDAGERLVVLDSRPMDEFRVMSIPGGVCCPGAELVHRVGDAAPDPDTLVVVNCAGRTRSIIGAQSLINAGIPNRVTALRNGTMGWHLAGYDLAHGRTERPPPRGAAWREGSARAAERLAKRFGVEYVDAATLAAWRGEAGRRSLYRLRCAKPRGVPRGTPRGRGPRRRRAARSGHGRLHRHPRGAHRPRRRRRGARDPRRVVAPADGMGGVRGAGRPRGGGPRPRARSGRPGRGPRPGRS